MFRIRCISFFLIVVTIFIIDKIIAPTPTAINKILANRELFITNARRRLMYGLEQINPVSRFINEMDKDLIDDLSEKSFEFFSNIDYNNVSEVKENPKDNYEEKEMNYAVGDFVYHENFGAGTVIEIIPNKDPTKTLLKIAFKLPYGVKTLLYNHKNLRKV